MKEDLKRTKMEEIAQLHSYPCSQPAYEVWFCQRSMSHKTYSSRGYHCESPQTLLDETEVRQHADNNKNRHFLPHPIHVTAQWK